MELVAGDDDACGLDDTAHEEEHGQQETQLDSYGEVKEYREEEGHGEHGDIALRATQRSAYRAPSAHVVRDDDEHTREAGHRDVGHQGHEEEEDQ